MTVPSFTGELGAGLQLGLGGAKVVDDRRQAKLGAQQRELLGGLRRMSLGLGGASPAQQKMASLELLSADPQGAKSFFDSYSSLTTDAQEKAKDRNNRIGLASANILQFGDDKLQAATLQTAKAFADLGMDDLANQSLQLSQLPAEQLRPRLEALTAQARDVESVIASGEKKAKALADKAQNDLDRDIKNSKDEFEMIDKLRKGVQSTSKEHLKVRDAYGRVKAIFDTNDQASIEAFLSNASQSQNAQEIAKNTEAFGDMALIFNYMKMLDPGSTVREGEFASVQNTGNVNAKIRNLYNQALKGTRLTDAQRSGLRRQAEGLFKSSKDKNDKDIQKFKNSATANNLPFDQIFDVEEEAEVETDGNVITSSGGIQFKVK